MFSDVQLSQLQKFSCCSGPCDTPKLSAIKRMEEEKEFKNFLNANVKQITFKGK
jgi:hypothetical protein